MSAYEMRKFLFKLHRKLSPVDSQDDTMDSNIKVWKVIQAEENDKGGPHKVRKAMGYGGINHT